jgi:hypothetical protein
MHFLQAISSDLSVLIVCNKTSGTIKRRYKKILLLMTNLNPVAYSKLVIIKPKYSFRINWS